jgi:hypothetical protein
VPAGKPFAPVRGKRIRVTRLLATAAPDAVGVAAMGISSGFISVKLTPQWDDVPEIKIKTADGDLCVNEPSVPVLANFQAEIAFCGVDPDLFSLISGNAAVVDANAAGVGMRMGGGVPVTSGFGFEVWSGVAGSQAAWGYFLLPYCYGGKISDFTVENGAANFTLTTMTREGSLWGTGPYNVINTSTTASVTPGKLLQPIGSRDHLHFERTPIAPPAATNGLSAVVA